tara:strand:- start:330 stop:818 length:489 start_codon:yes stop_codon:yes gene_type:complete
MKNIKLIITFVITISLISCSSSKINKDEILSKTNYNNLKIVKTSKIVDNDTIIFNELRFYNINSALDTMKSMFLDFGTWTAEDTGLHQENITRKVWEKVKLFEDKEEFSIVADGTETMTDFYACLIIVDSANRDCLDENYPLKNKIIDFFYERMKKNKNKKG